MKNVMFKKLCLKSAKVAKEKENKTAKPGSQKRSYNVKHKTLFSLKYIFFRILYSTFAFKLD